MQSKAWLAVKCMLRDSNADDNWPTVYFGYNNREYNWNNFYCNIKYSTTNNQQLSYIQKYNLEMVLNLVYPNLRWKMEVKDLVLWGTTKLRNENETKRNETKRSVLFVLYNYNCSVYISWLSDSFFSLKLTELG
jgi:hypothetical protein